MKVILLKVSIQILQLIYFFFKLLPTQDKVVLISRFSDKETLDLRLLRKEIENQKPQYKVVVLTKRIPKGLIEKTVYLIYILKKMYHLATSKACIIDSYIITISLLNHKKDLKVIQIWHALGAIKKFGYQVIGKTDGYSEEIAEIMRMHKNYDYVICSGEGTVGAYSEAFNISEDKILTIGMPRVDYLKKQKSILNPDLIKRYPQVKEKSNIVYVPTFRKNRELELDELVNSVDYNNYNLILKPHPNEKIDISDNRVILDYEYPSMDWMKYADYIITDYSAVAFEAMILEKPLLFYLFDYEEYKEGTGINIDWFNDIPQYTSKSGKEIIGIIQKGKYDKGIYKNLRDKYLSAIQYDCTKEIIKYLGI